jgi:hypothetical protein
VRHERHGRRRLKQSEKSTRDGSGAPQWRARRAALWLSGLTKRAGLRAREPRGGSKERKRQNTNATCVWKGRRSATPLLSCALL